jgi:predicted small lipoprotein YifL
MTTIKNLVLLAAFALLAGCGVGGGTSTPASEGGRVVDATQDVASQDERVLDAIHDVDPSTYEADDDIWLDIIGSACDVLASGGDFDDIAREIVKNFDGEEKQTTVAQAMGAGMRIECPEYM